MGAQGEASVVESGNHRQTPFGHSQTPFGHSQTPFGHSQTPFGHSLNCPSLPKPARRGGLHLGIEPTGAVRDGPSPQGALRKSKSTAWLRVHSLPAKTQIPVHGSLLYVIHV
jgi:hypothetical protein